MTPTAFLTELDAAGVCLARAGDGLRYRTRPGVSIGSFADRIRKHKPALLRELRLREQIMAALAVEPADFDRAEYDRLWRLWHAQAAKGDSTP